MIGTQKTKKQKKFSLIKGQQNVVQVKKCDHDITCSTLVKNNINLNKKVNLIILGG